MTILSELYQQKSNAIYAIFYHAGICTMIPIITGCAILISVFYYWLCLDYAARHKAATDRTENFAATLVNVVWGVGLYICPLFFAYHLFCIPLSVYRWWTASVTIDVILSTTA